jgi:hypothetical protein
MMRAILSLLLVALLFGADIAAPAQPAGDAVPPERLRWLPVRGNTFELSVAPDGTAYALDAEGRVWRRAVGANSTWVGVPGNFTRIDAGPDGRAWAVGDGGGVFRYTGSWWEPLGGGARDVGVGADGSVFIADAEGKVARFDPRRREFLRIPEPPAGAERIDVDDRGLPWIVMTGGDTARFDGNGWLRLPGKAADISVGPEGTAYKIGDDRRPYRWDAKAGQWLPLEAIAAVVAVGPGGRPWIATPEGLIYATELPNAVARGQAQPRVITALLNWRRVRGTARTIAANANGDVYTIGGEHEVWEWKGRNNWSLLPGRLERIAVDPSGVPWGVDADGRILQYRGNFWAEMPGSARDIAIGANGALWILTPDGSPALWNAMKREWQPLAGLTGTAIAVAPDGRPWLVTAAGEVQRHDGEKWIALPGVKAQGIALSVEGAVFAAGVDNRPYRYDPERTTWDPLNGEASAIALGVRGAPWAVTAQSAVYTTAAIEEERPREQTGIVVAPLAKPPPGYVLPKTVLQAAPVTTPVSTLQFRLVSGQARDISIGTDGSIFAIGFDGGVLRWSNAQNRFLSFPGVLLRVAVAADGKPWGVTTDGHVFRHDGVDWRLVLDIQNVIDIGIGADGTVLVIDGSQLYRYNAEIARFRPLFSPKGNQAPSATRLAVDRSGNAWLVTRNNQLYRCDRDPCELVPVPARDVGIAPDNTVIVVDVDRLLRRLAPGASQFELIPAPNVQGADAVAVGPRGQPWVVTASNQVYASAFFPRDESGDLVLGLRTVQSTTPASAPVFVFTQTPSLQVSFSSQPMSHLAVGANGVVAALDVGRTQIHIYNAATNHFILDNALSTLPAPIQTPLQDIAIAADGTFWISDNASNVYRRIGNRYVPVPGLSSNTGFPSPVSIGTAANGVVLASSADDTVFQYDPASQRFVKFNPQPPAPGALIVRADPGGNPWVVTPFNDVYALVAGTWVKRSIQASAMSIGANGTVYLIDAATSKLKRWNNSNQSFDNINTPNPISDVAAVPDGRFWVIGPLFQLLRAR